MKVKTLAESNLGDPLGNVSTELCGPVKVLHKMWEQAENIQGKT